MLVDVAKCTIDIEQTVVTNVNMSELTMKYYAASLETTVILGV